MPLSSSNAARQLSDGNSQGTIFGQSGTDLIAFYGSTAVARATIVGSNTISTVVSSTGAFGFGDATTASTVIAVINQLKIMGIIG
jgi:hypothetical protein